MKKEYSYQYKFPNLPFNHELNKGLLLNIGGLTIQNSHTYNLVFGSERFQQDKFLLFPISIILLNLGDALIEELSLEIEYPSTEYLFLPFLDIQAKEFDKTYVSNEKILRGFYKKVLYPKSQVVGVESLTVPELLITNKFDLKTQLKLSRTGYTTVFSVRFAISIKQEDRVLGTSLFDVYGIKCGDIAELEKIFLKHLGGEAPLPQINQSSLMYSNSFSELLSDGVPEKYKDVVSGKFFLSDIADEQKCIGVKGFNS
ncbi:MAG: hypothetical protein AAFY45_18770 [Bacteroidota bacterium]